MAELNGVPLAESAPLWRWAADLFEGADAGARVFWVPWRCVDLPPNAAGGWWAATDVGGVCAGLAARRWHADSARTGEELTSEELWSIVTHGLLSVAQSPRHGLVADVERTGLLRESERSAIRARIERDVAAAMEDAHERLWAPLLEATGLLGDPRLWRYHPMGKASLESGHREFDLLIAGPSGFACVLPAEEDRNSLDQRVRSIGEAGPPARRVDLVIVGDGYVAEDLEPGGKWEADVTHLVKGLFRKEPFQSLRAHFNVHVVDGRSQERGAQRWPKGVRRRTAFGAAYGFGRSRRTLVCRYEDAVLEAARKAPAVDVVLVLVNDEQHGGSCSRHEGVAIATCAAREELPGTAAHELGHALANLADEYEDGSQAGFRPLPVFGDLEAPNVTLARCVDGSTPERLIETLKWGRLQVASGEGNSFGASLHEGGYYRRSGVYRPAPTCIMRDSEEASFCFVCMAEMRMAIQGIAGCDPEGERTPCY